MGRTLQPMDAHQKNTSAHPIPWFSKKKKLAHGLGWAGLGWAGPGEAHPIRSPDSDTERNSYCTYQQEKITKSVH